MNSWWLGPLLLAAVAVCTPVKRGSGQAPLPGDSGTAAVAASLMPGDAIQLTFWREPQLSGEYPVDETGLVVLPLLGDRAVLEIPASELKRKLLDDYGQQIRNQEVRITFLRRVRILGAVKNPGLYRVDPTMTVVDVIALAGGASSEGKLKGIEVLRNGVRVHSHLDTNLQLIEQIRSGDEIVVPQRGWFARNGLYVVAAGISAIGVIVARAIP